jgi:hypothetical protein
MGRRIAVTMALASVLAAGVDARAQDADAVRAAVDQKAKPGDRLTVRTSDGSKYRGRLVSAEADALLVELGGGRTSFPYTDVRRVSRYINGIVLGAAIGAGIGLGAGIPLAQWGANEHDTSVPRAVASITALHAALGMLIDSQIGRDRTIYERPGTVRGAFDVQPRKGGGAIRWTATW